MTEHDEIINEMRKALARHDDGPTAAVIVDDLREALARHDAWPTREAAAVVIIHARRLIRAIDQPAQTIQELIE